MSAKNKNTKNTKAKKSNKKKKPLSKSTRAGLSFPVPRIRKYIKDGKYGNRMPVDTPIFLAAVLEYLVAEVLELAGNCAKDKKKKTIVPRDVMIAIRMDDELGRLCKDVTFPHAGTPCEINPALLKNVKKKYKKKKKASTSDESGGDESQRF